MSHAMQSIINRKKHMRTGVLYDRLIKKIMSDFELSSAKSGQHLKFLFSLALIKVLKYFLNTYTNENNADCIISPVQIEAEWFKRQEAATRRERALAYAFEHQVPGCPLILFLHLGLY